MKILALHTDYIKFKALKKALKSIEDLSEKEKKEQEVKEALVIMTAVEKTDANVKEAVKKLVEEVKKIASQVNAKNVVLYPYAHLSSNLSSPKTAVSVLEEAEKVLKKDYKVVRAPFGYYKEFELKVKGHPLSELSRNIVLEGNEEELDLSEDERKRLWKSMSKNKMQSIPGKKGLKSNVELGKELDLYIVNEVVGPGLPLLTPKGATIKREIERFTVDEELKRGYEYTSTPIMAKSDLYKISGHWQHYKKDMFVLNIEGKEYALRPMTCPFQFVLYKRKPRSYRDLPKKYAEIATLYRKEQSGELRGLTRLWQFTLADGHIICTPEQLEEEFLKVMDLVKYIMKTFNIEVWYRFSKGDLKNKKNKFVDNPKAWEASEKSMKKILDKMKIDYVEAEGEAAFYGPKLDLQYKDVYGKEDTLLTIQIDFALPERFDLKYLDKDGKEKRPMVIHRSVAGATERIIAYLLEKTQGNLPTWLSPIQVKVLNMSDKNLKYSKEILEKLRLEGIRVELNGSSESMGKKVRKAQLQKVNYMLTLGDKEEKGKVLAVRNRKGEIEYEVKLEDFISKLKKEIEERK